jgi:hypothetical protein
LPDWLIERGIGETRAVRLDAGEIVESRILLEGVVPAGTVLHARLVSIMLEPLARSFAPIRTSRCSCTSVARRTWRSRRS